MSFQNLTQANPYNLFCNSISNSSGLITSGEAIRFDSVINNSGGYAYFNNLFATGTVEITTLEAANANLGVLQADSILSLSTVTGSGDFDIGGDLAVVGSSTVSALQANSIASLSTISAAGNISSSGAYSGASSAITGLGSFGSISSSGGISSSGALTAPSCSISGLGSFGSISSSGNINSSGSITSGTANFTNINVSGGNSVLSNISTLNSVQFGASTQQINIHRGLAGTQYIFFTI